AHVPSRTGRPSLLTCHVDPPDLHALPTRRSSDLRAATTGITTASSPTTSTAAAPGNTYQVLGGKILQVNIVSLSDKAQPAVAFKDRKSTRLNSSHVKISYAVFCLKKKDEGRRRRA